MQTLLIIKVLQANLALLQSNFFLLGQNLIKNIFLKPKQPNRILKQHNYLFLLLTLKIKNLMNLNKAKYMLNILWLNNISILNNQPQAIKELPFLFMNRRLLRFPTFIINLPFSQETQQLTVDLDLLFILITSVLFYFM